MRRLYVISRGFSGFISRAVRRLAYGCFALISLIGCSGLNQSAAASDDTLELRTFPVGPIYESPINQQLHINDAFLHNLALINRGEDTIALEQITFSVMSGDDVLNRRIVNKDAIEVSAERFHRNAGFGVFERLPELFGQNVMFDNGEELSPTTELSSQTALIRIQEYFAYQNSADRLAVEVTYSSNGSATPNTDLFSIPIERYASPNTYQSPVKGNWYVLTGPDIAGHHRVWQNTEFAYDFSRIGEGGLQHRNNGFAPSDYYAFGEPVFAIGEGVVVKAIDRYPEAPLREEGESVSAYQNRMSARMNENFANDPDANYGNIVVIEHANGELSSYTHLKSGTLLVKTGERVAAGEPIGEVGQSGNSLTPHLHFSVANSSGRSLPVAFASVRSIDSDTISTILKTGEFIRAE